MEKRPVTRRLMTHPGVGVLRALAFELVIGTPERFHCGKQIASYVGLVSSEESSGDRRGLGHISKQGSSLLRYLLVEAAQVTVRSQQHWRSKFFHLAMRRGRKIAKVAMARKLAVHLYWMWREGWGISGLSRVQTELHPLLPCQPGCPIITPVIYCTPVHPRAASVAGLVHVLFPGVEQRVSQFEESRSSAG
jgi:Transposase IS116/IS110/IS902 family